jgi:hypothetical protein
MGDPKPMWPPSEKQVNYVLLLQTERELPSEYVPKYEDEIRAMEKDEVSRLIGELKVLAYVSPKGRGQSSTPPDMPAGRYALQDNEGKWSFFQIDKPTEGRWAGYTFIKRLIGAPGQYRKEQVSATVRYAIMDRIAKDPQKAMTDYGLQSGVCGRCSSPLTDPESLARGIGPICIQKLGW